MTEDGFFERLRQEIAHWRRSTWSFADVGAHWDAADQYDEINRETYSYFRRFIDGLRLSDLPTGCRVLDVCARTGNGTAYFFANGRVASAVCADVSFNMGRICAERLGQAGLKEFIWLPLGGYELPLASQVLDAVLCFESVEHFPHPERLVMELGRVTRPGGLLVLTTPNVLWEPVHALAAVTGLHHSEGPHRFIRYRRLEAMIDAAGFTIEKAETTVLVPGGPRIFVRAGEWVEERTRRWLMPLVGLRRIFIGRKR